MIGYPITYGDTLEEGSGFTSETVFNEVSEYCSDKKNQENFYTGYKFGLLFFSVAGLFLASTPAFAEGELANHGTAQGAGSTAHGAGSSTGTGSGPSGTPPPPTPTPGPAKGAPGSLAKVPTAGRGVYTASTLGICGIAMKTGAFYVGFICAAAVLVGVRMAGVPADAAM